MIYSNCCHYRIDLTIVRLYKVNQAQTNGKTISRISNNSKIKDCIAKVHFYGSFIAFVSYFYTSALSW